MSFTDDATDFGEWGQALDGTSRWHLFGRPRDASVWEIISGTGHDVDTEHSEDGAGPLIRNDDASGRSVRVDEASKSVGRLAALLRASISGEHSQPSVR